MSLFKTEPKEFAVIATYPTKHWNSLRSLKKQHEMVRERLYQALTTNETVAGWLDGTFQWRFVELPESVSEEVDLVAVRATIMAYPKEGAVV